MATLHASYGKIFGISRNAVEILHHGPLATRRFKRFSLGYAGAEDVDVLARMEQASPEQAIAQFLALVPTLDMYG